MTICKEKHLGSASLLTVLLALVPLPASTTGMNTNHPGPDHHGVKVFPLDSRPYGLTYGEWTAKWWQWEFSLPTSWNPWFDTGANAGVGQSGPVYFLTGILTGEPVVERTVSVPAGTALFFPVFNAWCDNVDVPPPTMTWKQLQECAASFVEGANDLHVRVDGKNIDKLSHYRVKSPPFCDWFPATDNVYQTQFGSTFSGWNCPVASDGYWIMLAPLKVGEHTINFGGTNGTFTLDVTYHVTVARWKDLAPPPPP